MSHDPNHHEADPTAGDQPDPKSTPLFLLGALSTAALITICLLLFFVYQTAFNREWEAKVTSEGQTEGQKAVEAQLEELRYDRRDESGTLVAIPVDRAIELLVEEQAGE